MLKGKDSTPYFDDITWSFYKDYKIEPELLQKYHKLHNLLSGRVFHTKLKKSLLKSVSIGGEEVKSISFEILALPEIDVEKFKDKSRIKLEYVPWETLGEVFEWESSIIGISKHYQDVFWHEIQLKIANDIIRAFGKMYGSQLAKSLGYSFWLHNAKFVSFEDGNLHFIITDLWRSISILMKQKGVSEFVEREGKESFLQRFSGDLFGLLN